MLTFEVSVNGKRLCSAGTETSDVMSVIVSWTRRIPDDLNFHVGGVVRGRKHEHFGFTTPDITIGDEITIRLVESDTCDVPDEVHEFCRNPNDPGAPPATH